MRTVIAAASVPIDDGGDVNLWMAPGAHVVHYPLRGGGEHALVLVAPLVISDDGWAQPAEKSVVEAAAARFPDRVRALIARGGRWRRHAIHQLAPLPSFAAGRLALVGDAAHPMAPFMAQGAVMALEDAMVLAGMIARHGPTPEALGHYSAGRLARAQRVVRRSRLNGLVYHQARPASLARNLVLKLCPGARLLAGLDWLYGWCAPSE
jgi:salicylate hydroxylase